MDEEPKTQLPDKEENYTTATPPPELTPEEIQKYGKDEYSDSSGDVPDKES
jgi:hypothetical protein